MEQQQHKPQRVRVAEQELQPRMFITAVMNICDKLYYGWEDSLHNLTFKHEFTSPSKTTILLPVTSFISRPENTLDLDIEISVFVTVNTRCLLHATLPFLVRTHLCGSRVC